MNVSQLHENPEGEQKYRALAIGHLGCAIDSLKMAIHFSPGPQNYLGLVPRLEELRKEISTK